MPTLKIPAAYLEDARTALATELVMDGEAIRDNGGLQENPAADLEILERDAQLYGQLLAADGDAEVSAKQDRRSSPIGYMLDEMVRVVARRLDETKEYGPIPMGQVLEIADELRWAATEAIQIVDGGE